MTFTDNEKAIINTRSSYKQIRLEFPDHEIEDIGNSQVALDAMSLEESIFEGDNLTFGKCNGSIFKIRVADFTENIENARMNVYVKFTNEELGEVDVPFGKYIISQPPERTSDRRWRDITATDYMTLFDVDIADWYNNTLYPTSETTRTVKYIRTELCKYIDVKCEDTTLINDDLIISKTVEPTSLSGRDLLQNICEINACFGHFDWDGILRFITLDFSGLYPSENLFPSQNLYPRGKSADNEYILSYKQDRCNYEDYDVKEINTVAITKEEGGLAVVYRQPQVTAEEEVENRYTITGNILLYEYDETVLENVAKKICDKISGCSYRPNDVEVFGGIYMHLGQSYTVHSTFIVGSDIIENPYESYILKRTIKGIQTMSQVLEAHGEQYQPETQDHDIMTQLSVLKGRSAKYKRDFDELVVEYKDFEQGTSSHFSITDQAIEAEVTRATQAENGIKEDYGSKFEQTAESITAEVTRATNAEKGLSDNISNVNSTLSSKIEQTAESITSTVANTQNVWVEEYPDRYPITPRFRDYGVPQSTSYTQSEFNNLNLQPNDYYLDVNTGKIYKWEIGAMTTSRVRVDWTYLAQLKNQTVEMYSRIDQTATSITSTVAGYQTVWDETDYYIKWKDYGITESIQVESGSTNYPIIYDYYLDVETGLLYRIATVTKDTEQSDEDYDYYKVTYASNPTQLKTTRQAVTSEIEQTATSIRSEVSTADGKLSSRIEQTLKTITLAVEDNGTEAGIYITTEKEDGTKSSKTKVGTITLNGLVRFTNLSTSGETTINGANIQTGTLSADKITTGTMSCDRLKGGTISGQTINGGTISGSNITGGTISSSDDTTGNYTEISGGIIQTNALIANAMQANSGINMYNNGGVDFVHWINGGAGWTISERLRFTGGNIWAQSNFIANTVQVAQPGTSTAAANCRLTTLDSQGGGTAGLIWWASTSSMTVKHDFCTKISEELDPHKLYEVKIYQYKYKTDYIDNERDIRYNKDVIGFIAEQLDRHYPIAVDWHYDAKKERKVVEDWNTKYIIPPMLKLIQEQHKEIETLKEENKTIKDELATLQKQVAFLMSKIGE